VAVDYRQTGVDYRQTGVSYRGVQDAAVAPAVVAGVAAVPSPTVSGDAGVAPGVVTATAAVLASTVSGAAGVSAATIVAVAAVPSATAAGHANVTAGVVAAAGAVPAATASQTASVTPDTIPALAAVPTPDQVRRVTLDTTNTLPSLAKGDTDYRPLTAANRLARHYSPRAKGVNVWIASGAVTTTQPSDNTTITRTLYGGHEGPDDLTETESDLLAAAGYRIDVEAA